MGQKIYDAYDDGISLDYVHDMFRSVSSAAETDGGFEYAFAFTGVENLTLKLFWQIGTCL